MLHGAGNSLDRSTIASETLNHLLGTRTRVLTLPHAFASESMTCGVLSQRRSGGDGNPGGIPLLRCRADGSSADPSPAHAAVVAPPQSVTTAQIPGAFERTGPTAHGSAPRSSRARVAGARSPNKIRLHEPFRRMSVSPKRISAVIRSAPFAQTDGLPHRTHSLL